ncbi:PepSY domain-containing protein [Stagnihabitans tardus]|uniref:PepSY domain-containing protein n=1 Tax=Stagnihabitans tardus TaxID=2699202 RepID=A0AAE4Y944_9RHOB|nr:PepSY domain-containing protein [Stagnihabitans tardus]NBZ88246.1 hypothetical protein [Stagnihabitans tardus]
MNRRKLITVMAGALVFPALGAFAQDVGESIVAQLRAQGYTQIDIETTWLGRIRILATRGGGQREIIANPRTGEILRDVWTGARDGTRTTILDDVDDDAGASSGGTSGSGSSGSGSSGSGSGSGSDDDGEDDDSDSGGSHGGSGSGKDDSDDKDSGKDDSDDDKSDDSDDDSGKDDN